jgi:hypothetical protein
MSPAGEVKPVQAGLCDDDWPIGVSPPRMRSSVQHQLLCRIGHLHNHKQQMGLVFAPRNVLNGVVPNLSQPSRIEKPNQWECGWHIEERRCARAGLESFTNLGARIPSEGSHDCRLPRPGFAEQPHDRRQLVSTPAGFMLAAV